MSGAAKGPPAAPPGAPAEHPDIEHTSIENPMPDKGILTLDPDLLPPPEEATLQGASYLVERITPVPPSRSAMDPRGKPPASAGPPAPAAAAAKVITEEPTAAVQNPGSRPPQSVLERPTVAVPTGPLKVSAASVPADGSLVPMSRPGADAPSHLETAFVPVPGQPGAQAQTQARPQVADAAPAARAPAGGSKLQQLLHKIQGSKSARLGIIAGGGLLGIALVLVLFSPPKQQALQPVAPVDVSPQQTAPTPPPEPPKEETDPAKVEEKDALLEKAILALEAGRTDEALAIFRRYTEEDQNPAAEFMVQFLQLQISQSGKER